MNKGGDAGGVIIGKKDGYILIGDEADETVIGAYGEPTSIALTTSGAHNMVWLELGAGETIIDWGDGHIEDHDYNYPCITNHVYADDGDYTITLIGDKTTGLYVGYTASELADITAVDIGTQYGKVVLGYCDLTSLFVPKGVDVTTVNGTDVASVVYENGATAIGEYDYERHSWKSTSTGEYFSGCESLSSVTIPDSIKIIKVDAFDNTPYKTANASNYCFTAGKVAVTTVNADSKNVVIPNTVKYINPWFSYEVGMSYVSGLTIGSAVEEIGEYAFYSQYRITSVSIPNSTTKIGEYAFFGCPLSALTLGSGLTSIGAHAFDPYQINTLSSVTIPASVTSIGAGAFMRNSKLTEIHFEGSTPPATTGAIIDIEPYIFVPVGAVPAYEAAGFTNVHEEGWAPPSPQKMTWATGKLDPTTGAEATDASKKRTALASTIVTDVQSVEGTGAVDVATFTLGIYLYNKTTKAYAGTYNGTSIVQGETWAYNANNWDYSWKCDLSSLAATYDFRFVVAGRWSSAGDPTNMFTVTGVPVS